MPLEFPQLATRTQRVTTMLYRCYIPFCWPKKLSRQEGFTMRLTNCFSQQTLMVRFSVCFGCRLVFVFDVCSRRIPKAKRLNVLQGIHLLWGGEGVWYIRTV